MTFFLGGADYGGGFTVADLNNDGCDDIIAGSYRYNSQGRAYIFYGSSSLSGALSAADADIIGEGNSTDRLYFGMTLNSADLNKDGYEDLMISSLSSDYLTSGLIFVFYNKNGTFDFTQEDVKIKSENSSFLGVAPLMVLDTDGDGKKDILIPDFYSNGHGMFLYSNINYSTGTKTTTFFSPERSSSLDFFSRGGGYFVGDINKDGKDDFCTSGYKAIDTLTNQGRVYCWYGKSSFNSNVSATDADIIISGSEANEDFGRAVSLADLNNDGNLDLIVGAYQTDMPAGSRHGKVFVYKGNGVSFETIPWISEVKIDGNTAYGNVVSAFDWNNDGWQELMVTQGGTASNGTGSSIVNIYNLLHGNLSVSVDPIVPSLTNSPGFITGVATNTNAINLEGVQWNLGGNPSNEWTNCSADDGAFDSLSENYTCDISSITKNGTYKVYVRSFDENDLYMPSKDYKYSNITVDTIGQKPRITDIGLISNVPNKDSLFYYFTSQTPLIKGTAEKNGKVYFIFGEHTYSASTDSSGKFEIKISIPELPRSYVKLKYYAKDEAGNKSDSRTLEMIIGEENFPDEKNNSANIDKQPINREDAVVPTLFQYEVVDGSNKLLAGVIVSIQGQEYISDEKGYIYVEDKLVDNDKVEIVDGKETFSGLVLDFKINVQEYQSTITGTPTVTPEVIEVKKSFGWYWYLLILALLVIGGGYYYQKRSK